MIMQPWFLHLLHQPYVLKRDVITNEITQRVSHNGPVNLAFGTRTSLLEVIAILQEILGRPLNVDHREERIGDVRHSQADNSILRNLFPDVNPVSLDQGLRTTVEWLHNYLGV